MKLKLLLLPLIVLFIVSCAPKVNSDVYIKSTDAYTLEIQQNSTLKEAKTRGALTDETGFNDIGSFTYVEKYSEDERLLFHIKNIEKTDQTLTENYYYKENKLVLITSATNSTDLKKLYLKNGKVLSRVNIGLEQQKILHNKAKLFKKQFESAH